MKKCRNCIYWYQTYGWKGNCKKHLWPKDKYGEDADPTSMGCEDYADKADERREMVKGV